MNTPEVAVLLTHSFRGSRGVPDIQDSGLRVSAIGPDLSGRFFSGAGIDVHHGYGIPPPLPETLQWPPRYSFQLR